MQFPINREVVVVCGYGCHLTDSIKKYLDAVLNYLLENRGKRTFIIIPSGGFTNQVTAPGVSEAGMMADYLRESCRMFAPHEVVFIPEDRAITTLENLKNAREFIDKSLTPPNKITIFCDESRQWKICYLAKRIFQGFHSVEVRPHVFGRSWNDKLKQYLVATPVEILALYFPRVNNRMRARRLALNATR
ncbi:MAG: ElyC/SanA/YdcF family protein [bacterium]|nr:ElyC/SanA/YdcF family protein [bacterium]